MNQVCEHSGTRVHDLDSAGVCIFCGQRPLLIEVLHQRDPDSECYLRVFIDGKEVQVDDEADVDPGRGWTREDWNRRIEENDTDGARSPAFRAAIATALDQASDSEYITD